MNVPGWKYQISDNILTSTFNFREHLKYVLTYVIQEAIWPIQISSTSHVEFNPSTLLIML